MTDEKTREEELKNDLKYCPEDDVVRAELKGIQEERERILKLIDELSYMEGFGEDGFCVVDVEELKQKIKEQGE